MIERFKGDAIRLEAISNLNLVGHNSDLAKEIDERGELVEISAGTEFIQQGDDGNDVYLILAGTCDVVVNGRRIAKRGPGNSVGEMAAIQPTQPRSASCIAAETVVAIKLSEPNFSDVGSRYPQIFRAVAKELARRLLERNASINAYREKIRVFIISSVESLEIARLIENAFEYDPFLTTVWTDGVFKIANYTLQSLEDKVDDSDFAIAIAHSDDEIKVRGKKWPAPRDNVIFELGLFMGRLGKARAILMEPRDEKVKLPSDLTGITTIPYRFQKGADAPALMAAACNKLRSHILELGPNNG